VLHLWTLGGGVKTDRDLRFWHRWWSSSGI
jgi:hypothetical protein